MLQKELVVGGKQKKAQYWAFESFCSYLNFGCSMISDFGLCLDNFVSSESLNVVMV